MLKVLSWQEHPIFLDGCFILTGIGIKLAGCN
jgi:hypothetical protein